MKDLQESVLKAYQKHYPDLLRYALSILKDKHAAEEVVQELCVKILERRDLFERIAPGSRRAYFTKAIYHASLNYRKAQNRFVALDPDYSDSARSFEDKDLLGIEARELFMHLTADWPEEMRTAFIAHVVEGVPLKDIAEQMGIKPNTLTKRINRLRKKFCLNLLFFILLHMLYD